MRSINRSGRESTHPYLSELEDLYREGRITRRGFIRNASLLGVSLTGISAFLSRESWDAAAASHAPMRGGTLRTEYNWIPYVEDPAADGIGTGAVGLSIAEALVWVGEDGAPRPQLVKSWESNDATTEWTLHLQEGVTFNNGKPFGADDVIWNIKHWLNPDTGSSMAAALDFLSPEGVEKVDDLTIRLRLDRPNADVLLSFYDYPSMIAPEGGWKDFYSGNPADAVGTGPFMMEEFIPDERIVLVRNPNYWRKGADGKALPYVDKVIVTAGWDDAARLAALIGNEADLLTPGEGIIGELEKYPDEIGIESFTTGWITPIVMRVDMAPFDDVRVRQALKLVQDRKKIQELVQPKGQVAYDHWIPASAAAYCPDTDSDGRPQDIERARALLAEAGHGDGLDIELSTPDDFFQTGLRPGVQGDGGQGRRQHQHQHASQLCVLGSMAGVAVLRQRLERADSGDQEHQPGVALRGRLDRILLLQQGSGCPPGCGRRDGRHRGEAQAVLSNPEHHAGGFRLHHPVLRRDVPRKTKQRAPAGDLVQRRISLAPDVAVRRVGGTSPTRTL